MALDLEKGIAALAAWIGNSYYSMEGSRNYSDESCDCSGAVYYMLRAAGGYNFGYTPSTETLHAYLINLGYKLIAVNQDFPMKRGQIIIWGQKGHSAGAFGHTGVAIDNQNWIECTAWSGAGPYGGTIIANHDQRWAMAGGPYFYAYEYQGTTVSTPTPKPEQKPEQPKMEELNMKPQIYWKKRSLSTNDSDAFIVFGNKRAHIPDGKWLDECRQFVKRQTGATDKDEFVYGNDNFQVLMIEAMTEKVDLKYYATK